MGIAGANGRTVTRSLSTVSVSFIVVSEKSSDVRGVWNPAPSSSVASSVGRMTTGALAGRSISAGSGRTGVDGVNEITLSRDAAEECALDMSELGGVSGATNGAAKGFWTAVTAVRDFESTSGPGGRAVGAVGGSADEMVHDEDSLRAGRGCVWNVGILALTGEGELMVTGELVSVSRSLDFTFRRGVNEVLGGAGEVGRTEATDEATSLRAWAFFFLLGPVDAEESRSSTILTTAPSLNPILLATFFTGFGNLVPIVVCRSLPTDTVGFGFRGWLASASPADCRSPIADTVPFALRGQLGPASSDPSRDNPPRTSSCSRDW